MWLCSDGSRYLVAVKQDHANRHDQEREQGETSLVDDRHRTSARIGVGEELAAQLQTDINLCRDASSDGPW